jgi:hypothetical protein
VWSHLPAEALIARYVPPYGLAPRKWMAQLEAIRQLPERPAEGPEEKAA